MTQADIQRLFDRSLIDSNLKDASLDISNLTIDEILNSGYFSEIPIVRTIAGIIKTGVNIQDRLFLKKILSFFEGIDDIPPSERKKVIDAIDNSKKYRIRVGEKLLYLIDTCADYEVSELLAALFSAFLRKAIDYDEFVKAAHIVSKNQAVTIKNFIKTEDEYIDMSQDDVEIETGLYVVGSNEISVDVVENNDWKINKQFIAEVGDGGLWASPSKAGLIIRKVFVGDEK